MVRAFVKADLRVALPGNATPTLLSHSEPDTRSPRGVARPLHAALSNSTLVFMPSVGHEAYLESRTEFNAQLPAFAEARCALAHACPVSRS